MKTKIILLVSLLLAMFIACFFFYIPRMKYKKTTPVVEKVYTPQVKVVFIVTNPDIDFNQMDIVEVTNIITQDSILHISPLSPELYIKPQIIKVYRVEDITCPYLKKRFKNNKPGELVYEYNDKVLIKLKDGVIKVYHSHLLNK